MSQGFLVHMPPRLTKTDGTPAVGWLITTYASGTTTPLTTYSDPGLTSQNTNPIVTDSTGFFRCYVAAGTLIKFSTTDDSSVPQLQYSFDQNEPMVNPTASNPSVTAVPAGGMVFYGAAAAPTGFLLCNGALVSRATYATLFGIISTTYGAGDGSTTFALPDLRGAFPLGKAASGTGSTLGGTGGAIDHTHTGPSHTHVTTVPRANWGQILNAPSTTGTINTGYASGAGQFNSSYQATSDQDVTSAAGGTGNTGTGNPPFVVGTWIIKT